ncbi:MAG: hypothetical protein FWB86_06595 [Treponema sp.]|nr:hypothetical protein [Treponema sp.]MCL2251277.1 hypothetical protein [Treponema sp.]
MITLERVRLVNWHNFIDTTIEIGNHCLLAGDNGSGKSTIIDAVQYVIAANLRMAKFNSAAEERKGGGRDLMGYVRCKLGAEATEYRRDNTIAHIMLQWSHSGNIDFACGVCIEAYSDNRYTEHFWIADIGKTSSIKEIDVLNEKNQPLPFRLFKNNSKININDCATKQQYIKDLTNRLGVYKRQPDVNPYIDSLTRSIGFKPLSSIDKFVCDYILEENLVKIDIMKQNLENYKEADRQARTAVAKIDSLKKINVKAAEWKNFNGLILKQEYLKLKIELENVKQKKENASRALTETENRLEVISREIVTLDQKRIDLDEQLRVVLFSIATNDAHRQYEEISQRIKRLEHELAVEEKNAEHYRNIKNQCEALLETIFQKYTLTENFNEESDKIAQEQKKYLEQKFNARQRAETTNIALRETLTELADLERGILHYPSGPRELRASLEKAGINAVFLAELAEITNPEWINAVEGWLNTQRFAVLVDPADFQKALEVYDKLPRSVAGGLLPNIEKMRNATARTGSLAKLIKTNNVYAEIYINFILGKVMCADISSLREYESAVTKECMRYSNHTASRIMEDIYKRHYLGRAAVEERRNFLKTEKTRLEAELTAAEREERTASEHEDCCNRVLRFIPEMKILFSSIERAVSCKKDLSKAETELAAIDTQSFKDLENKKNEIDTELLLIRKNYDVRLNTKGGLEKDIIRSHDELENLSIQQQEKEESIKYFSNDNPTMINDCETYAQEKLSKSSIEELNSSYESTLKNFKTRTDSLKKEYIDLVRSYEHEFNHFLNMEPADNSEAETLMKRLETSELPEYREKIAKAYQDAEKEFKDHFISRLNEHIEEARQSFDEINEILRTLHFGRDQYRFHLEELNERKGQIEVIRNAAKIPSADSGLYGEGLFAQITDPNEKEAAKNLFDRILNAPDSEELRSICDYRTYFHYDIIITETDHFDDKGLPVKLSLSRVLKVKSGGESQTPYYVAIAASFYRFYKNRPENTVRLVIFDEAFNRMDDERIGKILLFYNNLNLQIITSVPPEKIEAIAPYMDRINIISRSGEAVKVRNCHIDAINASELNINMEI